MSFILSFMLFLIAVWSAFASLAALASNLIWSFKAFASSTSTVFLSSPSIFSGDGPLFFPKTPGSSDCINNLSLSACLRTSNGGLSGSTDKTASMLEGVACRPVKSVNLLSSSISSGVFWIWLDNPINLFSFDSVLLFTTNSITSWTSTLDPTSFGSSPSLASKLVHPSSIDPALYFPVFSFIESSIQSLSILLSFGVLPVILSQLSLVNLKPFKLAKPFSSNMFWVIDLLSAIWLFSKLIASTISFTFSLSLATYLGMSLSDNPCGSGAFLPWLTSNTFFRNCFSTSLTEPALACFPVFTLTTDSIFPSESKFTFNELCFPFWVLAINGSSIDGFVSKDSPSFFVGSTSIGSDTPVYFSWMSDISFSNILILFLALTLFLLERSSISISLETTRSLSALSVIFGSIFSCILALDILASTSFIRASSPTILMSISFICSSVAVLNIVDMSCFVALELFTLYSKSLYVFENLLEAVSYLPWGVTLLANAEPAPNIPWTITLPATSDGSISIPASILLWAEESPPAVAPTTVVARADFVLPSVAVSFDTLPINPKVK